MCDEWLSTRLIELITGYRVSQAIHVAAMLGIADLLKDGPRDSPDLAVATGAHPPSLYRLLRALAAVDVFQEGPVGRFSLTQIGTCLCSGAAGSVAPLAALFGRPHGWQAWSYLLHTVQTGENAFRHAHGTDPWEFRLRYPEERAAFDHAMTVMSHRDAFAIVAGFDFRRFRRIVDVGGGEGRLIAGILAECATSTGVLFDLPEVVASAADLLKQAGVADRCEVIGGSFFDAIPAGGDAYILKSVIHNWADQEAADILFGCRQAIRREACVLVIERILAPPNEGAHLKFLDLQMLVGPNGRERTVEEFAILLDAAGFDLIAVHPTGSDLSVLEAAPRECPLGVPLKA
jgi:hypothetical protein